MANEVTVKASFPNLKAFHGDFHPLKCPDCFEWMESFSCQSEVLQKCSNCEGIWFDRHQLGVFKESLMQFDLSKIRISFVNEYERAGGISKCPKCHELLHPFHYSYNSKVLLERCENCDGIWSPLKQTLAFIDLARISQAIEPDVKQLGKEMAALERDASVWRDLSRASSEVNQHASYSSQRHAVLIALPLQAEGPDGVPWLTFSFMLSVVVVPFLKNELIGNPPQLIGALVFLWVFGTRFEVGVGRIAYLLILAIGALTLGIEAATCTVLGGYLALWPTKNVQLMMLRKTIRVPSWMFSVGWVLLISLWCATGIYQGYDLNYLKSELYGAAMGFGCSAMISRFVGKSF